MGGNYTLPMFVSYGLILAFILLNQVHIQSQTTTPSCQPHQDPYPTLAHQQGNDPGPNLTQSLLALTMDCQSTSPPLQPPWGHNPGPILAQSLLPSMNEGLSINTTSMTSICHLQEVYGHKAEKMRQKSLKHPQALALSSDDDVLSSTLVPHVGWKHLQVLPQILSMTLPRLSALDTMDPLDRARVLAKLLPDSVPEAKEGDKIYELGALCPKVFASHKPTAKSQWLLTGNTSILFIIGSLSRSFLWRQLLVRYTEGRMV